MKKKPKWMAALLLLAGGTLEASDNPVSLFPRLQAGQKLLYLIRYRSETGVKSESRVVAPMAPSDSQVDAHGLLQVEILELRAKGGGLTIHARARFLPPDSAGWLKRPEDQLPEEKVGPDRPAGKMIEFVIASDGHLENLTGVETLALDQQRAWWEWVTRFEMAWTLPAGGVKMNKKQRSVQPLGPGSPLAGLHWERESVYVRDEPCRPSELTPAGELSPAAGAADSCAVLLTAGSLRQGSSPRDATPQDYKLHDLKSSGTAQGTSQLITYISLTTGLVVRATEESTQRMDVLVALADHSNSVRYKVQASSNSQVLLISESAVAFP